MLPTPAKTPKKKKVASQPGSAARVLFPPRATETEMPPSKRMKGASLDEISMENFGCGRRSRKNDIEVFVDSRDQIPDVNLSKENPFIVHSDDEEEEEEEEEEETAPPSPSKGIQQKERQLDKGNEIRKPGIEKSVHRDDGMLYTFRGKKIFKKFEEEEEEDEDEDEDLEASLLNELDEDLADMKPLSRSSIKPKVLFPTSKPKRTPAPGAPDVFVRTPSPEATVPERMTPEAEANDAEPIDDEPQKTTEVDEDEQSLPQTDGAPLASSPPATPAKQCPTTVMPQTPRTLRPRGIKAYLSPIKSASKPQPKKRTIEPHQPSEQQEQSQQPHQREHRQTPDQEESPSSQDSAPPPAETPAREGRTLRSHHAAVEARLKSPEPVAEKKKRGSPFDSWRRTKPTAAAASPTTRAGGKVKKRTATTAPSAEAEAPVEAVNSKKVRSK
ncbi:hypothetical protein KEM55_001535 [Ascosphaera atra]|nr:hypothetical protein KEM55_001535 [Ascosphaera atra]